MSDESKGGFVGAVIFGFGAGIGWSVAMALVALLNR